MKKVLFLLCFMLLYISGNSQTNTEVYVFDYTPGFGLTNPVNISNNPGVYDNQPSFIDDETLLFSSTRNGQTDIRKMNIRTKEETWLSVTDGSEYSPLKVPEKALVSAIRLDKDGKQLLYVYDMDTGIFKALRDSLKVGYHVWYDNHTVVSFVLGAQSSLVVSDLEKKNDIIYQKNIGRSLHKIPGTNLISYVSKSSEPWELRSLDPATGKIEFLVKMPEGAEDMCWTPAGVALVSKGSQIYEYNPSVNQNWNYGQNLAEFGLRGISRLAVNPSGNKIAVVVTEQPPEIVVQAQLEAYNKRDIYAFLDTFDDQAELYEFPHKFISKGKYALRKRYEEMFKNTPDLHSNIKNRIVQGNTVIDHEEITRNGQILYIIAIYEVSNGKITKATFIR
ncbi:nuclear transport factor 2 family protein [Ascidiimonas sp. W6]|uniref:nuclear transport factor 2 family protein n=1 Tax=Ascidiimonas meishanensis TaxID=3128903 RepID=UPI0030EF02B1